MADWKDRLRPASFRGVPFGVQSTAREGGRRVAVHVFPQRDTPLVEEMGREPRAFSVEAYIVGDDFAERTARLIARLEGASAGFPQRPGGTLVHPTIGQVEVLCRRFREEERDDEGRMARVSIDFVEAGREIQPFGAIDPVGSADSAAAAAGAVAGETYAEEVTVAGVLQQGLDAIEDTIREVDDRLRRLDVFSGLLRNVEALEIALSDLVAQASELATAPADLAGSASDALDNVLAAAATASGALEAYRVLFDLEPAPFPGEGPAAVLVRANAREVVDLFRTLALAGAVRAAARVEWASLEDALAARAELEALLDELSSGTHDDRNRELAALRLALVGSVPPPLETLPRILEVTLPASLPALVLAQQLYQDPGRDAELVARNHVANPLRVPGGVALAVLSS